MAKPLDVGEGFSDVQLDIVQATGLSWAGSVDEQFIRLFRVILGHTVFAHLPSVRWSPAHHEALGGNNKPDQQVPRFGELIVIILRVTRVRFEFTTRGL